MAFDREVNVTKIGIEDFAVEFFVPGPNNDEDVQSGRLSTQILASDNSISNRNFDLLERLGDDAAGLVHLQNLADLRDYIRTRLNDEVLP